MNIEYVADECIRLISLTSELLGLRRPDIYFIVNNRNEFNLLDDKLKIISHDLKDVPYTVNTILYVDKEYSLYVNLKAVQDKTRRYVVCFKVVRQIYQAITVQLYNEDNKNLKLDFHASKWAYCYKNNVTGSGVPMPLAIDRDAFAALMFEQMYDIKYTPSGEYYDRFYEEAYYNASRSINIFLLYDLQEKYFLNGEKKNEKRKK